MKSEEKKKTLNLFRNLGNLANLVPYSSLPPFALLSSHRSPSKAAAAAEWGGDGGWKKEVLAPPGGVKTGDGFTSEGAFLVTALPPLS